MVMSDKPEPVAEGYVRFWIEHDTEVAMLTASDFRNAMNERDRLRAENERLRATLRRAADAPCSHCSAAWRHGEQNTAHFIADQVVR